MAGRQEHASTRRNTTKNRNSKTFYNDISVQITTVLVLGLKPVTSTVFPGSAMHSTFTIRCPCLSNPLTICII